MLTSINEERGQVAAQPSLDSFKGNEWWLVAIEKPVRFRICAGVSFRLECSERARFGRSDISMATKCFSWALDRLYRYHKKAEAIQKRGKRFTKDSFFSPSYISFS